MKKYVNGIAILGLCSLLLVTLLTLIDIGTRSQWLYELRDWQPWLDELFIRLQLDSLSDLFGLLGVFSVAACFPATLAGRYAITVRVISHWLPPRGQALLDSMGMLVLLAMIGLISWELSLYTWSLYQTQETTWILMIPIWPVWSLVTLFFWISVLVQIRVTLTSMSQCCRRELSKSPPSAHNDDVLV